MNAHLALAMLSLGHVGKVPVTTPAKAEPPRAEVTARPSEPVAGPRVASEIAALAARWMEARR